MAVCLERSVCSTSPVVELVTDARLMWEVLGTAICLCSLRTTFGRRWVNTQRLRRHSLVGAKATCQQNAMFFLITIVYTGSSRFWFRVLCYFVTNTVLHVWLHVFSDECCALVNTLDCFMLIWYYDNNDIMAKYVSVNAKVDSSITSTWLHTQHCITIISL